MNEKKVPIELGRKPKALLAYLLYKAGKWQNRENVAELLWPDKPQDKSNASLNTALWQVKRFIETTADLSEYIQLVTDNEVVSARGSDVVDYDYKKLEEVYQKIEMIADEFDLIVANEDLTSTLLEDYCESFLDGIDESWVLEHREYYNTLKVRLFSRLADMCIAKSELTGALDCASKILQVDNLCERGYHYIMYIYAFNGQRAKAIKKFREFASLLRVELDVDPDHDTTDLVDYISCPRNACEIRDYFSDRFMNKNQEFSVF